jgi:hypothetical protein
MVDTIVSPHLWRRFAPGTNSMASARSGPDDINGAGLWRGRHDSVMAAPEHIVSDTLLRIDFSDGMVVDVGNVE